MGYFDNYAALFVSNDDTSDETDINTFATEVFNAFEAVEVDIVALEANQNQAIKWARDNQGVLISEVIGGVTVTGYSARAHAIEASEWANSQDGIINKADGTTSATLSAREQAEAAASSASDSADSAVTSSEWAEAAIGTGAPGVSGGSSKAWADTAEDTPVYDAKYSAKHWAAKAAASAVIAVGQNTLSAGDGIRIDTTGAGPYDFEINNTRVAEGTGFTVTVGVGGDYSTLNEALEDVYETYYPVYRSTGVRVTIQLLGSYVLNHQVIADSIDLSWITITGADAITTINSTGFTLYSGESAYNESVPSVFLAINGGRLPIIRQRFSNSGAAVNNVVFKTLGAGSVITLGDDSGASNCGVHRPLQVKYGSTAYVSSASTWASNTPGFCLCQSSRIICENSLTISNNASISSAEGGVVVVKALTATGSTSSIYSSTDGGSIIMTGAVVYGQMIAQFDGKILADSVTLNTSGTNPTTAITCTTGGIINIANGVAYASTNAISCSSGGRVKANAAGLSSTGGAAIYCNGGSVDAYSGLLTGVTNTVQVLNGGDVSVVNGSLTPTQCSVLSGSILRAASTSATLASGSFNSLTGGWLALK